MDIEKYIKTKCNYGYVIEKDDGSLITVILGDSGAPIDDNAPVFDHNIHLKYTQMKTLFSQNVLSVDDKKCLAKLMKSMKVICNKKMRGLCTPTEQIDFMNALSIREQAQLVEQIEMRNKCEKYHQDYIH